MSWGLSPLDENARAIWTARAIFTPSREPVVDLLHDRQDGKGDLATRKEMSQWLNNTGLKLLKGRIEETALRGDQSVMLRIEEGGYVLRACPQASFGYLYLCCETSLVKVGDVVKDIQASVEGGL